MHNFMIIAFVICVTKAYATEKYYGVKSTEAILSFSAQILASTKISSLQELRQNKNELSDIESQIESQVQHLIGHFQSKSYLKSFPHPGVLGKNHQFKVTRIETSNSKNKKIVSYSFKGKINFHSLAFKNKKNIKIPLRLPFDPLNIYRLGVVAKTNKCTDSTYNSEGDFFYFWDPDQSGCPLRNNSLDVFRFEGDLTLLENTKISYPEFDRLYKKGKDGATINIFVFLGYIDDNNINPSRVNRNDDALYTYDDLRSELTKLSFSVVEEKSNFKLTSSASETKGINFYSLLSKKIKNDFGEIMTVNVEMLVADSGQNIPDPTFHRYFSTALERSDIVAYDGHSGLGAHLSFEVLPQIFFKPNYQIYFFNGCSSYPYFNDIYFTAKPGGKKNLEIVTSGLPTLTSTSYTNMSAFLSPFIRGEVISYQTLMRRIERSNGQVETYLMGINGDEDNKFKP